MRLDCPFCGTRVRVDAGETPSEPTELHGEERMCRDCGRVFGVYHF